MEKIKIDYKGYLNELLLRVMQDFYKIKIPIDKNIDPDVRVSSAKRIWGSCKKVEGGYNFKISVSKICFDEPNYSQFIKNVLAHELLHTIEGCFNHSEKFKKYAQICAGYGYNIEVRANSKKEKTEEELFKEANHILRCNDCGKLYFRYRFPKKKGFLESLRCGKCGGKLTKIK